MYLDHLPFEVMHKSLESLNYYIDTKNHRYYKSKLHKDGYGTGSDLGTGTEKGKISTG